MIFVEDFGYDWKPADKRKPRANEILKFRRVEPECREYFALWNGDRYYIFDIYTCRWKTLEQFLFVYPEENVRAEVLGFRYAYIPKDQVKYIPYWALANSRKGEIPNVK